MTIQKTTTIDQTHGASKNPDGKGSSFFGKNIGEQVFGLAVILVAFLVFASGARSLFNAARLTLVGSKTEGVVSSIVTSNRRGSRGGVKRRLPVIDFSVDGVNYQFNEDAGTWRARSDLSGTVPVVYLASNPQIASVDSIWYLWYRGVVGSTISLVFVTAGFLIMRFGRNHVSA